MSSRWSEAQFYLSTHLHTHTHHTHIQTHVHNMHTHVHNHQYTHTHTHTPGLMSKVDLAATTDFGCCWIQQHDVTFPYNYMSLISIGQIVHNCLYALAIPTTNVQVGVEGHQWITHLNVVRSEQELPVEIRLFNEVIISDG